MISSKIRFTLSRDRRHRFGVTIAAFVVAVPLAAQPSVWQYVIALIVADDLVLRIGRVVHDRVRTPGEEVESK